MQSADAHMRNVCTNAQAHLSACHMICSHVGQRPRAWDKYLRNICKYKRFEGGRYEFLKEFTRVHTSSLEIPAVVSRRAQKFLAASSGDWCVQGSQDKRAQTLRKAGQACALERVHESRNLSNFRANSASRNLMYGIKCARCFISASVH